ncbi:hypothetical protein Tco_0545669 [Tanacetum coccineum]
MVEVYEVALMRCLGLMYAAAEVVKIGIRALSYRELGALVSTDITTYLLNMAYYAFYCLSIICFLKTGAAYQLMIAETDPTQRKEALTVYGIETGQNSVPVLETALTESSLETLSMDELITQLRKMCEDAEDHASNAQEEARQKRKEALEEVVQQIYRTNN